MINACTDKELFERLKRNFVPRCGYPANSAGEMKIVFMFCEVLKLGIKAFLEALEDVLQMMTFAEENLFPMSYRLSNSFTFFFNFSKTMLFFL